MKVISTRNITSKDGSDFIGGKYLTAFNLTTSIPKLLENSQTITAFTESGALHPDFQRKFFPLIVDENTLVYLYCRTGNRTGTLGNALVNQVGLRNVTHLKTGIVGWKKDGLITVPYESD